MPKHRKTPEPMPRQKCSGKNCYTSRLEAELVKTEQELLVRDLELTIYRCHLCQQWHLSRRDTTTAHDTIY